MQQFLDECKQYPRQYSPEWFSSSHITIGGSEMDALMSDVTVLCKKKAAQIAEEAHTCHALDSMCPQTKTTRTDESASATHGETVSVIDVTTPETEASTREPCKDAIVTDIDDDVASPEMYEHAKAHGQASACACAPCQDAPIADDDVASPEMYAQAKAKAQVRTGAPCQDVPIADDDVASPEMYAQAQAQVCASHVTVAREGAAIPRKEISIYDSGVPMGWGTMFEPLLCSYIERRANLVIKGRSISYMPGPFRYSPDGLFEDHAGNCAILELKNPFTRVWRTWSTDDNNQFTEPHLTQNAPREIPPQYVGQLQLGLHMIKCAKYAYFAEAIYRRTTKQGHVSAIKMQSMAKVRDAPAIESGIIGFYHTCASARTGEIINLANARARPIDFSSRAHDEELCYILTHLRDDENSFYPRYFQHPEGRASAHSSMPYTSVKQMPKTITMSELDDDEDEDDGVQSEHDGKGATLYLIGYMPWSLIGIHTVRLDRDPTYISDTIVARATEIVNALTLLRDSQL